MRCSCTKVAGGLSCPPSIARIISAVEGRMALKNFVRSLVASLPLGAVASALQPWLPGDRRGDSRTSRRQYDCIAVACACSIALALLSPCSVLLSLLNLFFRERKFRKKIRFRQVEFDDRKTATLTTKRQNDTTFCGFHSAICYTCYRHFTHFLS